MDGALTAPHVRPTDLVARLGGDEFVVVLDGSTGSSSAEVLPSRARQTLDAVLADRWDDVVAGLRVSVSAGFARGLARDVDAVLEEADRQLYRAKDGGRGRLVTANAP